MRHALPILLAATLPLAACSGVKEAMYGPTMTPMKYPAALVQKQTAASIAAAQPPQVEAGSANSIWRPSAREFFNDQRASRVGDILTVLIEINDAAKTSNATNASRTGTNAAGITNLFGLEKAIGRFLPSGYSPQNAVNTSSSLASAGTGGTTRQEQITLTIAAVVTQVLPNGNLVIEGSQEVKTDYDVRELTVAGIVRPEDISSTNTILHTQIAEARINYGGRGDVSSVQKTPGGTALMQRYMPF
jgi:flagellar L-ring protein FlgH